MLLGTPLGNILGTWKEHVGNKRKMKKNPAFPPPKTTKNKKKKKKKGDLSACWAFPLAAWNFYFQNCSSPFLAWAKFCFCSYVILIFFTHLSIRIAIQDSSPLRWGVKGNSERQMIFPFDNSFNSGKRAFLLFRFTGNVWNAPCGWSRR